jgi:hypothetical protein
MLKLIVGRIASSNCLDTVVRLQLPRHENRNVLLAYFAKRLEFFILVCPKSGFADHNHTN